MKRDTTTRTILWLGALCALILSSCTTPMGSYTIASSQNVDLSKEYEEVGNVDVEEEAYIIVFFPTSDLRPTHLFLEALRKAEAENDAQFIADVRAEAYYMYIPFIYGVQRVTVTGKAMRAKQ